MPVKDIAARIKGEINYGNGRKENRPDLAMRFWGESGSASFPRKSLDTWFVTENKRWGDLAGRSGHRSPGEPDQPVRPVAEGGHGAWP